MMPPGFAGPMPPMGPPAPTPTGAGMFAGTGVPNPAAPQTPAIPGF